MPTAEIQNLLAAVASRTWMKSRMWALCAAADPCAAPMFWLAIVRAAIRPMKVPSSATRMMKSAKPLRPLCSRRYSSSAASSIAARASATAGGSSALRPAHTTQSP